MSAGRERPSDLDRAVSAGHWRTLLGALVMTGHLGRAPMTIGNLGHARLGVADAVALLDFQRWSRGRDARLRHRPRLCRIEVPGREGEHRARCVEGAAAMTTSSARVDDSARPALSAWRFVTVFGTVSLLADFVYEGARSITGPLLASLGASGLVVGVVTGVGEAAGLGGAGCEARDEG